MPSRYVGLACCLLLTPAVLRGDTADDMQLMVQRIDHLVAQRWAAAKVEVAEPATDAEFMRRVYLDLTGVIPSVYETREFLGDSSPTKRHTLVDRLLRSRRHALHMAVTWRRILLPGGTGEQNVPADAGLERWLSKQFESNFRYDRLVAEFLVATGQANEGPGLFYTAQELKPEKLASSTARIFLGLQIGCAQCHDHPLDKWTQEDFWSFAAFFARLEQPNESGNMVRIVERESGEVMLPDTETVALPKFPGGSVSTASRLRTRREQLALWMASRENPFLARAAVNWAWAHLFGRGLVDPVDDIGPHNPPSHPQLMDELSEYFVRSGYDLRKLLATLARTRAYQLSSRSTGGRRSEPQDFSVMAVKTLTPEQLYDSLQVVLAKSDRSQTDAPSDPIVIDQARRLFLAKLRTQSRSALEFNAGLPQALMLMHGSEISEATDIKTSSLLVALTAPFFTESQRLEILYLATLARKPSADERDLYSELKSTTGDEDLPSLRSDMLWAILNSTEFAMNH